MSHRFCLSACALVLLIPLAVFAQTAKPWTPPHMPDGQPDLQGVWTTATLTSLERPAEFAGKEFFTEKEAADYEKRLLEQGNRDRRTGSAEADVAGAYNEFWFERGSKIVGSRRTSLIIDPPDGKIPALTPEAQKRQAARAEYRRLHPADGPADLSLNNRCILWPTAGPPMLPGGYNNNYQIVQSPGYVVILVEMIHDARIIPLDGRPHVPQNVRLLMGDSRGHWEGNTLVVETTNFTDKTAFRGSGPNLHLIERFTRTSPDTIVYEFTANDESSFTRPWTAQIPMKKTPDPLFEYACHEGNYGMEGILKGARAEEKKASGGK
ncbi:MAG TPA: hypothetical protein VE422_01395 [Terriglobia bacterium]|nr:hypothetical protein [Terriglobia bacterium]